MFADGRTSARSTRPLFFDFGGVRPGVGKHNTRKNMLVFLDLLWSADPAKIAEYLLSSSPSKAARRAFDVLGGAVLANSNLHDVLCLSKAQSRAWSGASSSSRLSIPVGFRAHFDATLRRMTKAGAIVLPGFSPDADLYELPSLEDPATPPPRGSRLQAKMGQAQAAAAAPSGIWKIAQLRELLDEPQSLAVLQWMVANRKHLTAQVRCAGAATFQPRVVYDAVVAAWRLTRLKLCTGCAPPPTRPACRSQARPPHRLRSCFVAARVVRARGAVRGVVKRGRGRRRAPTRFSVSVPHLPDTLPCRSAAAEPFCACIAAVLSPSSFSVLEPQIERQLTLVPEALKVVMGRCKCDPVAEHHSIAHAAAEV